MANNLYFLQGSPDTDLSKVTSSAGTIYVKNYVNNNKESNRIYIGTSNAIGGIKSFVTPTPYGLTLYLNDDILNENPWCGEDSDLSIRIPAVPNPTKDGVASIDNAIVRFNGTAGEIQNSSILINDSGNLIFDRGTYSLNIVPLTLTANRTLSIPDVSGVVATIPTSGTAVGSATKPIYLTGAGVATASNATVGSAIIPIYMNAGIITAFNTTIGSVAKPVYMKEGAITACSANIGAGLVPIYMKDGSFIASTSNLGSNIQPIYMNNGTLTALTATVGSGNQLIYINNGVLTASTSDVGTNTKPIYLKDGILTICDTTLEVNINGTALKATQDSNGNIITDTYVTLATAQTISGDKTFSGDIILTQDINYGSILPGSGVNGQLFFKSVNTNETYEYLPLTGGIVDGSITASSFIGSLNGTATNATNLYINTTSKNTKYYILGAAGVGNSSVYRALNNSGTNNTTGVYFNGASGVLYGAAWNDYAEFRETKEKIEPGRVIIEDGNGVLSLSLERLQPGAEIVSDTFGFAIGETNKCKTPVATSGRVLAYPYEDRNSYKAGDAVCSGPNGTVSKMTREEIKEYPDRIIGTVSEIPDYEVWGQSNIKVNNRIWIRIR